MLAYVAFIAEGLAVYLVLLAIGRFVKRRWRIPFGPIVHAFAAASGLYVAALVTESLVPSWLRLAFEVGVILFGTIILLTIVQRFVWEGSVAPGRKPPPKFVGELFNIVIFVAVVLLVLSSLYGVRIPGLLAGSGILAIILGLAVQDTLGNIMAGLALHFEKPYQTGDWLVVDNRNAQVTDMNWRATRLRTTDNIYLDIPNSQLARATIVNLSYPTSTHAMRLRVGVDYAEPPNDVKEVLLQAVRQARGVLQNPEPSVFLADFADSAATYEIKYWIDDHARFNEISDSVRTNVWYELKRRNIRIPFPTRTVEMMSTQTPDTTATVREWLRKQPHFACFTDEQLAGLAAKARPLRFGRGEWIIRQGEAGSSMFVLVRGNAVVSVLAHGQQAHVGQLRPGECFGEMSLLTGDARSASVIAKTDCDVVEIDKPAMAVLLQQSPDLVQELSELLARRRIETEGVIAQAAGARTSERQREYANTFVQRLRSFFQL